MKRTWLLIILTAIIVLGGTANAQQDSLSAFGWHPKFHSAWIEGLFLPVWLWPVLGGGTDVDLLRTRSYGTSRTQYAVGLRFWYGTGTDAERSSYKYEIPVYYDADALLQGRISYHRFSAVGLVGYSYRRWPELQPAYTGSRIKTGLELNYILYQGRVVLRFRVMGSFHGPDKEIEWGPISLGFAIGWFRE